MPVDDINDPVGYWGGLLPIGIAALVLAVAVVVVVLVVTRGPKRTAPPRPAWQPAIGEDPYARLRQETTARIGELADRHAAGQIDDRALHLGLSGVMRTFASGRLGIDTSAMTLLEVARRKDAAVLTGIIAHYYRPSFADEAEMRLRPGIDPGESARLAREAVASW